MSQQFTPSELSAAIVRSRNMVQMAVDALCDIIEEVTGSTPNRHRVEYVSLFWLMHLCDRVVFEEVSESGVSNHRDGELKPESLDVVAVPSSRARLVSKVGSSAAPVLVVDPYLKSSMTTELRGAARLRKVARWGTLPPLNMSVDFRARSSSIDTRDEVGKIHRLVALSAPVGLVERHHELCDWAKSNSNPHLKLMYTANAHQSSLAFRHLAFSQRQLGTKIAIHQHGGGYGTDETHFGEEHDIAVSDVFFTFGWSRPDLGFRVRSLPTAMPQRARCNSGDWFLLMSLPVTSHFYRFQPFLLPPHISRAIDETVSFVGELSASSEVHLRSSGDDVFPMEKLGQSRARVVSDASGGKGSVAASRAKLVIHNYFGTSWLETLAMNVPTVCFVPEGIHRFRAAAQPFVDALVRVGIIHYSGREAARFVNTFHGDPSSWWKSADVQEAREAFVARYANFSDNWLEAWQEEFESLLAE